MADHDDGHRLVQSGKHFIDAAGGLRIHAGGWLIEQEDGGAGGERAGNIHTLALADG